MDIESYWNERRALVDGALDRLLPPEGGGGGGVAAAMRYGVLGKGKRLRPVLCLAALEALGAEPAPFLPAACALEFVHAYSLIHDDLPAMDDDDYRRGRPTCHRVFGEATAVLAGDALLALAFETVSSLEGADEGAALRLVRLLARRAGTEGLVGGQALDIESEGKAVDAATLERIHSMKTAALIETSVVFGAVLAAAPAPLEAALASYGRSLGMAFQVTDDILDAAGDEERVGKRLRKDAGVRKATYPGILGLEAAREAARDFGGRALAALRDFGGAADPLREIARAVLTRDR
ncbi:MAG: polyprenyl synthetase family protein [bacterium]|nr:polyprenyl synthetase family protein [bacterium]